MLKKHKQDAFARRQAGASDFVTCTAEGKPLYYRNALRDLATAADRAGLNDGNMPQFSPHDPAHGDLTLDRGRTR